MTMALAVSALAVSISTFLATRFRDRRDLLLKMHQYLVTSDQQRGRRLIYHMPREVERIEDLSDEEYTLVNSVLANFNFLGIYYERRYIRRKDVLDIWGLTIARIYRGGEMFLAHRLGQVDNVNVWPHLDLLATDAYRYLHRKGLDEAISAGTLAPEPSDTGP